MSLHPTRVPTRDEVLAASGRPLPGTLKTISLVLAAIGAIVFIIGLFVAPDRAWAAFHANWMFFAMLSVAGTVFVAVQRITTARWSRAVVRFAEGYVAFLPIALVFLVLTFAFGRHYVFPWTTGVYPVPEKATYYNPIFITTRDLLIFAAMVVLGLWFIYTSVRLDVGGSTVDTGASWAAGLRARMRNGWRDERREIHSTHSLQGKIAVWMALLFGMGGSVLAWDLSMGLTLHFQSTLYSWWWFMGAWLTALMALALLILAWNSFLGGADGLIQESHFHDIGKLCFAFTAFWGYLTFGQYLVIWYGNVGEETWFMRLRLIPPWEWVTVTSATLVFVLPFFGLISRAAKVFKPTLALFAICSLVGMWMMRYIEMYPSAYGTTPTSTPLGLWEIGVTLLYLGLWGWSYLAFYDAFPRMRVTLMSSPFRDEVQIPVNPETMEPLPAHE